MLMPPMSGRAATSDGGSFPVMSPTPDTAEPEAILISSEEEDGAAHREDLAQFVSTWVRRWPSQSVSS